MHSRILYLNIFYFRNGFTLIQNTFNVCIQRLHFNVWIHFLVHFRFFEDNHGFDHGLFFLSLLILRATEKYRSIVLSFRFTSFFKQEFYFLYFPFRRRILSFIGRLIILVRWVVVTGAPSFRNLLEIWSVPEDSATYKVFTIFSTDVNSALSKTKSSHSFRICL